MKKYTHFKADIRNSTQISDLKSNLGIYNYYYYRRPLLNEDLPQGAPIARY